MDMITVTHCPSQMPKVQRYTMVIYLFVKDMGLHMESLFFL